MQRTADEAKASTNGGGRAGREEYLARIDGLIYGEDPFQGLVRGRQFVHPDLGFAFEAPPGFGLQNTPQAVLARDRAGRLMIFTGADLDGRGPEAGNAAYRFIFLSAGQMSRDEARAYQATINSFRELDPGEAARFRP